MKMCLFTAFLLLMLMSFSGCGETDTSSFSAQDGESTEQTIETNSGTVLKYTQTETLSNEVKGDHTMEIYDFSVFSNVEILNADLSAMTEGQLEVLYQQARYCQAMTDADTDTLREIVSEDAVFTHMSGRQQTREEYFTDIENGNLRYFTIGIDSPAIEIDDSLASVTFTSVLNANAYGARGTYRMSGTHWYEKRDGSWISVNNPKPN